MIVRILGEGQLEVPDSAIESLNALDAELESAINGGEEEKFRAALTSLLDRVHAVGTKLPDEVLQDSDLFLPPADATVEEVKEMLGDEGLIPG